MTCDCECSKVLLNIPYKIVTIISRSTHFKELLFTFIKIVYTLCIVWLVLGFLLQIEHMEKHVVMHIITA